MSALLHIGKSTTSGNLRVECFNPSLDISGGLCVSPSCLIPLILSKFLAEHFTDQFRIPTIEGPCWMEAPWPAMVLNLL